MEEEEQQQPIYNLPSMQMTEGMLKYQLNSDDIVKSVENHLLGRVPEMNPETNTVEYKYYKENRLINEKGMNYLANELRLRVTKIFKLSFFEESQAEEMELNFGYTTRDAIFEHWDSWEIQCISDASAILHAVVDPYIATLNSAVRGRFLAYLKYTQNFNENQIIREEPQRYREDKSMISSIPLIGRMMKR